MATLWLNRSIGADSVKIVCIVPVWRLRVSFQQMGPWAYYIYKLRCPRLDLAVFQCVSFPCSKFKELAPWPFFSKSFDVCGKSRLSVCVSPSNVIFFLNLPIGHFFLQVLMCIAGSGCASVCPLPFQFCSRSSPVLADPGQAGGCSTNTLAIL